jgi:1-acyl-sn-glycerol-3-phosphate acyltransferase
MVYFLLRGWVRIAFAFFYKGVRIEGLDKIPQDAGLLIIANHQNAFLDAILPAVFLPLKLHFLARSDIFKSGWAAWLLSLIHILPVYRKRDGHKEPLKNAETFKVCFQILAQKGNVLIFPEANQEMERRLRPLSKGFSRIAFGSLEANPNTKLYVLPIGLNYAHYFDFFSEVRIIIGDAICINDWERIWKENPPKASRELSKMAETHLQRVCVHINPETEREWFYPAATSAENLSDPQFFSDIKNQTQKTKISVSKNGRFSRLLHILPLFVSRKILHKKVKNPHFQPSVKFALHLVFIPLFYLVVLIAGLLVNLFPLALLYIVISALCIKLGL